MQAKFEVAVLVVGAVFVFFIDEASPGFIENMQVRLGFKVSMEFSVFLNSVPDDNSLAFTSIWSLMI